MSKEKSIPATLMNTLIDVARKERRGGRGRTGGDGDGPGFWPHRETISVEVATAYDEFLPIIIDRDDTPLDMENRPLDFNESPVFGRVVGDTTYSWGVTAEPAPNGGGAIDVVVKGVCVATVNILDENHHFVHWPAGGGLKSASYGPARLMWAPGGTGSKTCVIDLLGEDGKGWFGNEYCFTPTAGTDPVDITSDSWTTIAQTQTLIPANKAVWVSAGVTVEPLPTGVFTGNGVVYGDLRAKIVGLQSDGTLGGPLPDSGIHSIGACEVRSTGGITDYRPQASGGSTGYQDQRTWGYMLAASSIDRWIGIQVRGNTFSTGSVTSPRIDGRVHGVGSPGLTWIAIDQAAPDVTPNQIPATTTITAAGAGSFVMPDGHTNAFVECWGGGGGGSGVGIAIPQYSGGGGGGGAYAAKTYSGLTPGSSISYVVGAGGSAGVGGGFPTAGGDGGDTTWDGGSALLAKAGLGGNGSARGDGGGAAGSLGDTKYSGGRGGAGNGDGSQAGGAGGGGAGGTTAAGTDGDDTSSDGGAAGGAGGSSGGGAGGAGCSKPSPDGTAGTLPGGGGGGGAGAGSYVGGKAGAAGQIRVTTW